MFGILFFLFMAICGIIASIRMSILDIKMFNYQKEKGRKNLDDYWMNASGTYISRKTGRACIRSKYLGPKGHDCLIDCKTLEVIKDYTEEKNNRVKELVINSDKKDVTAYKWEFPINEFKNIKGTKYIDKTTGEVLVVRKLNVPLGMTGSYNPAYIYIFECYLSITNGHILRLTDDFLNSFEICDDNMNIINSYIEQFNIKQDQRREKGINGFESMFYYNYCNFSDYKLDWIYAAESLDYKKAEYVF